MHKMARYFILLFFIAAHLISFSQKTGEGKTVNEYSFRRANVVFPDNSFVNADLRDKNSIEKEVANILREKISNLKNENASLRLVNYKESPGGYHWTFEQMFGEVPIYNSQIKINLDKQYKVKSIFENSFDAKNWNKTEIEFQKNQILNQNIQSVLTQRNFPTNTNITSHPIIFVDLKNNIPQISHYVIVSGNAGLNRELLIDSKGILLIENDLNSYFSSPDSVVSAFVFLPDPLTSAEVLYGLPYEDAGDSDVIELNAQRKTVNITAKFQNDTFFLENSFVKIADFDGPSIPPAFSITPNFFYTRFQDGFEDVNAFYHISSFQNYIQSLGFSNLMNSPIPVDAHAASGADISFFSPSQGGMLYFGEGGIDDAEDADVVIHEYGHAISNSASPGTNFGDERKALDEAFGDYLASSYSRSINPFNWQKVFNWDGNNNNPVINWYGRNVATSKHYPEDSKNPNNPNDYYYPSEIFSSVMMQIWTELGQIVTDKLMLQAAYSFVENMSLKDAARLVVDADTALFGGTNFYVLYKFFVLRGLMDSIPCDLISNNGLLVSAGSDTLICPYEKIVLGANSTVSGGVSPYSYFWSPEMNLPCQNCTTNSITPDSTITYTLFVVDSKGCFASDTIAISTACLQKVKFSNTYKFTHNGEPLSIEFPLYSRQSTISIYDLLGRLIEQVIHYSDEKLAFDGHWLPQGVFFIKVHTEKDVSTIKILKIK